MNNPRNQNTINVPDLNINNYGLEEILNLFGLTPDFNENDMKEAKKKVLMMHPDKSRLDPKYFLFYSNAYKKLYSIHEFNNRSSKNINKMEDEYNLVVNRDDNKKNILDNFFDKNKNLKDSKNFNTWFNNEFDKTKIKTEEEETGYGDWFKSNDDIMGSGTAGSMREMQSQFNEKKNEIRSLVQHENISYMPTSNNTMTIGSELGGIFSGGGGGGMDLREAYTQTLIPVTEEDYRNKKKFNSVDEYSRYRDSQDVSAISETESQRLLEEQEKNEKVMSTHRAFEMAKQTEQHINKNKDFMSRIMKIENGNNKI